MIDLDAIAVELVDLKRRIGVVEDAVNLSIKRVVTAEHRMSVIEDRQVRSENILLDVQMGVSEVKGGIRAILAKLGAP